MNFIWGKGSHRQKLDYEGVPFKFHRSHNYGDMEKHFQQNFSREPNISRKRMVGRSGLDADVGRKKEGREKESQVGERLETTLVAIILEYLVRDEILTSTQSQHEEVHSEKEPATDHELHTEEGFMADQAHHTNTTEALF